MAIASLNVMLGLDTASFSQGVNSSIKMANDLASNLVHAGAAVTAIGAPFALLANSAINTADGFQKMAEKTGFSVEALSAIGGAASLAGASVDSVQTAVSAFHRATGDLDSASAETVTALSNIGLSIENLKGLSPESAFSAVVSALNSVEDVALRNDAAMVLLGKSATDLIPLFPALAAGMPAVIEKGREMGTVLSAEAATSAANFNDSLTNMSNAISALANNFIESGMLDSIASMVNGVASMVREFTQANPLLTQAAFAVGALAAVVGPVVVGIGLLIPALTALAPAVAALFGPVGLIVAGVAALTAFALANETVRNTIVAAWTAIEDRVGDLLDDIERAMSRAASAIKTVWDRWGPTIEALFRGVWEAVKGIFQAAWNLIGSVVTGSLTVISGAITAFAGVLTGNWGTFTEGIKMIWSGLWTAIKSILTAPLDAALATVSGFGTSVKGVFQGLYDTLVGHSIVPDLLSGINTEFGRLATETQPIVSSAMAGIAGVFDSLSGRVENLAKSLIGPGSAADKMKQFANSIKQDLIDAALAPLLGQLDQVTSRIGGIFGNASGGAAAGGIPGVGGSAGGAGAGGVSGALGAVGAIGSAVSAVSGIIGNFQNARMEGSLNAIALHTLQTANQLRDGIQPQVNTYLPFLEHINGVGWEIAHRVDDVSWLPSIHDRLVDIAAKETIVNVTVNNLVEAPV